MNKSAIMTRALEIRKATNSTMSVSLKQAWAESKTVVEYKIADWFYFKNLDQLGWQPEFYFTSNQILKETEKAIYVEMGMFHSNSGNNGNFTRNYWMPKSCVKKTA